MIYYNSRVLSHGLSGVQRYLGSIIDSCPKTGVMKPIYSTSHGVKGHLWEQLYLPFCLNKDDVLWSPSNTGPIITKCKHVVTIHDFATIDHPEWTTYLFGSAYRVILPKLVNSCDKIIAISEYTKSRVLEHCPVNEEKIVVIPNGVDERFFCNKNQSDFDRLEKYGIENKRYILSVSSIEPRKNISSIVKAWCRAAPLVDDDIWLVLVGKENNSIFADSGLSYIPERVIFTGFVNDDDLPMLYANSLMFVYVSFYEGFGLPLLEAMAAGSPIIASNNTSIPEVVGRSAMSVSPYSISDIADAMIAMASSSSLRESLSLDGINRAASFRWDFTAKKTIECLGSV